MGEIVQEESEVHQQPKIAVAVGKAQSGFYALKWTLENLVLSGQPVLLLHVRAPVRFIPTPMGNLPIEKSSQEVAKQFTTQRFKEAQKLLTEYTKMCDKRKVKAEVCHLENDLVHRELVNQIFKLGISKLVIGTSTHSRISRAFKSEAISSYVAKHAPDFCTVMVVYKGKLSFAKDASTRLPSSAISPVSTASDTSFSSNESFEDDMPRLHTDMECNGQDLTIGEVESAPHVRLSQNASLDLTRTSPELIFSRNHSTTGFFSPQNRRLSMETTPFMRRGRSSTGSSFKDIASGGRLITDTEEMPQGHSSTPSPLEDTASGARLITHIDERPSCSNGQGEEPCFATSVCESVTKEDRQAQRASNGDLDALNRWSSVDHDNTLIEVSSNKRDSGLPNLTAEPRLPRMLQVSSSAFPISYVEDEQDIEVLKSQFELAQREAELQARRCKKALEMAEEYEAQRNEEIRRRDEALKEAYTAKQHALKEARRCEELLFALGDARKKVEAMLLENEVYKQTAADESRKHAECQGALEATMRDAAIAREQAEQERTNCEKALLEVEETRKEKEHCEREMQMKLAEMRMALENETKLRRDVEERLLQESAAKRDALAAVRRIEQRYTEYTFEELQAATDNFCNENKLGGGGYGPVFKGKLHHTPVAIKVLAQEGLQGRGEFQREVELLSQIHHPHMVILLGACPEKACIVYEYMANGSLEDRLFCKDGSPPLPWYIRFRICFEVATALLFLHSRPEPIVHRDLKPGNILLDRNFVSKIGDIGIARLVPSNMTFNGPTMYRDTLPVGTFAYIDPDYQRTGVVSRESDVYALGIVMLQLLTAKPPIGVASMVENAVDNGHLETILDKSAGDWPLAEAMELACLGLQCAEPSRRHRANLGDLVLGKLEKIREFADAAAANMACTGPSGQNIPSIFFCPISQEIMEDPYIADDGFTYEHEAIKVWLAHHSTSPMTNLRLATKNLVPNYSLKSAIKEWQERNQFT